MVQSNDKFSMEERLIMVLHGSSFAMYEASLDKEDYEKYKKGKTEDFSEERMKNLELLDILVRLGFSTDELGTYLYKDVIAEAYERVKDLSRREDMDECRALMSELTNAFSNIYRYVAREWKEMGVKSFHLYIQKSIEAIDENKIDTELSKKIFGSSPDENNYGLQAFQIAAYAAKKYSFDNVDEYKKVAVKKLDNMPGDIVLKCPF